MRKMKAHLAHSRGPDAHFEPAEIPVPEVGPGQILIEVHATSLNPIDNKFLRADLGFNPDLPAVLHGDVAGVVTEVGDDVDRFDLDDEVYACAGGFKGHGGALAQFMVADARCVAFKPRDLNFAAAAALPLVALTAWEGLIDRANVHAGEHVLVHAGTGGVGHVALQLARLRRARVATTVSTETKAAQARELGADDIIFYKEETVEEYVERLTEGRGFDIVFDTVGGKTLEISFAATRQKGQVINITARSAHDLSPAFARGLTIHFECMPLPLLTGIGLERQGEILTEVSGLIDGGHLRPLIHPQQFTFDKVNEAHALFEAGGHTGKIVLTP